MGGPHELRGWSLAKSGGRRERRPTTTHNQRKRPGFLDATRDHAPAGRRAVIPTLSPQDGPAYKVRIPNGPPPLAHDGWLEFNRIKRGVRPIRLQNGDSESSVDVVFYLDRAGRITLPPLNPYAPLTYTTGDEKNYRRHRRWLSLVEPIVDEMRGRGLARPIAFPVGIVDMRPWQWAGFRVSATYTYYSALPLDAGNADPAVRRKIRQAVRMGYTCERVLGPKHVLTCLLETERRQGFSYGLTPIDFVRLRDLLGPERLRMYICYAPNGEPATVRVVLHASGHPAIDWVSGTASQHLQSGATQLLIRTVLDDLSVAGATAFDFEGANIPGVAAAKMAWGGELLPWFQVESFGFRGLARWGRGWLGYHRAGRK